MLVLSRKAGQSIQIGDNVSITVLRISATEIRIGIDAPPEVAVLRRELTQSTRTARTATQRLAS